MTQSLMYTGESIHILRDPLYFCWPVPLVFTIFFATVDFKGIGLISQSRMYFRNKWNKSKLFFLSSVALIFWLLCERSRERSWVPSEDPQMDKFTDHDTQDSSSFIYDAYSICIQFSETSLNTLAPSLWSPRTFSTDIQEQCTF